MRCQSQISHQFGFNFACFFFVFPICWTERLSRMRVYFFIYYTYNLVLSHSLMLFRTFGLHSVLFDFYCDRILKLSFAAALFLPGGGGMYRIGLCDRFVCIQLIVSQKSIYYDFVNKMCAYKEVNIAYSMPISMLSINDIAAPCQ